MSEVSLEDIASLAKRRGFIYQGSEVYGGLSGTWDYGPLGVALKRNIMQLWWKMFVDDLDDMYGVDAAILMNQKVWKASGHVDTFTDPLVECSNCHNRFRADKIDTSKCPTCGKTDTFGKPHQFNLMFNTHVGASWGSFEAPDGKHLAGDIKSIDNKTRQAEVMVPIKEGDTFDSVTVYEKNARTYLRPETAQGIFVNFLNVQKTGRLKIPFGIAQIGKAFRNEIVARQFIFRMREFEQMEMQYFIRPGTQKEWYETWKEIRMKWHLSLGIPKEKYRFHDHVKLAHYADAACDIEYEFPFGFKEVEGIHSRTDFDLKNHQEYSKKKMQYFDSEVNQNYIPYVIETSIGLDRTILMMLSEAYAEEDLSTAEKQDSRVVLRFPSKIAPMKLAVLPLVKKDGLPEIARTIMDDCKSHFRCFYEEKDTIGKRYRRMDAIGTPFCVTVDQQTKQDNTVTIRYRDTMQQERIPADKVREIVLKEINS